MEAKNVGRLVINLAETLGIGESQGEVLAKKLLKFVQVQKDAWPERKIFVEGSQNSIVRLRPSEDVIDETNKERDKSLGLVKLKDLTDLGVGQVFLVIWNNSGENHGYSNNIPDPMEIWIAEGKRQIENGDGSIDLDINYKIVGRLRHGSNEIDMSSDIGLYSGALELGDYAVILPV